VRKRSKYRPKPQLPDPLAWVLNGLKPVAEAGIVDVQIKNHSAIDALRRGVATRLDIDYIIEAFNMGLRPSTRTRSRQPRTRYTQPQSVVWMLGIGLC